jgi:hypothetical protein
MSANSSAQTTTTLITVEKLIERRVATHAHIMLVSGSIHLFIVALAFFNNFSKIFGTRGCDECT